MIATVWFVSPPDPTLGHDSQPDETWAPYVEHFVFWNLNWGTRIVQPVTPARTPAFTTADPLANLLISGVQAINATQQEQSDLDAL